MHRDAHKSTRINTINTRTPQDKRAIDGVRRLAAAPTRQAAWAEIQSFQMEVPLTPLTINHQ